MTDFQVPDKSLLTSVDRSADSFLIYDASASALKRTNANYLNDLTSHPVGIDDVQTLTNKTLTAPTISSPVLSGTLTGTYTLGGTPTFPAAVVTLTGSQTLTNKVLTSPTINSATITNPTLTTDTVSEFTSAAGVTIDGVLLKDSKMNGSYLTDASVTSAKVVGISKSVLTTDSNPYKFRVRRTAAQNTSAGTFVKVNFDTEDYDTNSNFDSTTNYRYTAPVSGFYQINGYVNLAASGGNFVLPAIYKNGAVYQRGDQINSTGACGVSYCDLIQLTAGDYIELFIFASNTVALDIGAGQQAYFSGYLMSRT